MRERWVHIAALMLIAVGCSLVAHAGGDEDKSGVRPQVIKLPSGPGSINGLGESFEPQLNSGTGSFRVPLEVPPGRAGFTPSLALVYNGGNGNGPLGLGWSLSYSGLEHVQRQTDKGLPSYNDASDVLVTSGGEELVPVAGGFWRTENEGAFDRFERLETGWKATHRDGGTSFFGVAEDSQIHDGANVFRWCLSRQEDTNGNTILYRYNEPEAFPDSKAPGDGQCYLTSIVYNQNATNSKCMKIAFRYEKRDSNDSLLDYRPRFPIQTSQRCAEITMLAGGVCARSYQLTYRTDSTLSQLARVMQFGRDAAQGPLPSILSLEYTPFAANSDVTAMDQGINPSLGIKSPDADLVDMNGDALPDLLTTGDRHRVYFNPDGRSWSDAYDIPAGYSNVKLSQINTMLMDMDGDGYTDIFQQDASINGYRYYRGGRPDNGWSDVQVEMKNSPAFTIGTDTKTVDLDNDGRTDVIRKIDQASSMTCFFNRLGERWSQGMVIDSPSKLSGFNFGADGKSTLQFADMNGDGIQDIVVFMGEGAIRYYPGRGVTFDPATPMEYQGWDATARGEWPSGSGRTEGYWMKDAPNRADDPDLVDLTKFRTMRPMDCNGDGLSDLVYVGNNRVCVWLNLGGNAFSAKPFVLNTGIPSFNNTTTAIRTADMNGNGTVDVVWNRQGGFGEIGAFKATWVYLDLTKNVKPNLLTTIDNGIGKTITIGYRSSTDCRIEDRKNKVEWKYKMPISVNVVASITVDDGFGNAYVTDLRYRDAYYDGVEKEFRGFGYAERIERGDDNKSIPTLVTTYEFDTGATVEALKGKPLRVVQRDEAGGVFNEVANTWDHRDLFTVSPPPGNPWRAKGIAFAFQTAAYKTVQERLPQSNWVTLRTESEYDDFGNCTRQLDYGRMDGDWDDERLITTEYTAAYPSGQAAWILDKVVETTTSDENGVIATQDGPIGAKQRRYYDGSLTLGEISRGNLTRMEDWVDGDRYIASQRSDYDAYGNLVASYDPLYGAQPGHYREFAYDPDYQTYPVRETVYTGNNAVPALDASATYDTAFGTVTAFTDFNRYTTTYDYDTYARLTAITKPPDVSPTVAYDYVLAHNLDTGRTNTPDDPRGGRLVNWVGTFQYDGKGGCVKLRTFSDGLGRKIMTRADGEREGEVVVSDTVQFNGRKLPWRKYLPYFETGTLDFMAPPFSGAYTEHHYDAMGRETQMVQPDGLYSTTTHEPLAKLLHDEEQTQPGSPHFGCGMRYVEDGLQDKDGKGRLREVHEIVRLDDLGELGLLTEWVTRYSYSLLDKVTGYIDSQNNRKSIQYDGVGRKTFMNDPDRGQMTYRYDDAGNLTRTIDAKGQAVEYEYDGTNRPLAEYYSAGKTTPDVEYHYDAPFGTVDRGDLWTPSLAEQISDAVLTGEPDLPAQYDMNKDDKVDVADVIQATRGAKSKPVNAVRARNALGRLAWVRDESGEEHISYDERGRGEWRIKRIIDTGPDDLRNFFTGVQYDSMDRVTRLTYPDRTYADYTYNPRGLLESVPGVITRLDYNQTGQSAQVALACGTTTQSSYDVRLRLSSIQTVRTADGRVLQDLNYAYDGVSNITAIGDGRSSDTLDKIGQELGIDPQEARKFENTQSFKYDSLYRLAQASNPAVHGTLTYRYDRIGNMVKQDATLTDPDPHMNLGQMACGGGAGTWNRDGRRPGTAPGPHAVTSTAQGPSAPTVFTYDDNGNMLSECEMAMTWDPKDRLVGLKNGQTEARYTYDYTGTRSLKVVPSGPKATKVFYVDKNSEMRDGVLTKYVFIGNMRVASGRGPAGEPALFRPEVFYLHDQVASSTFALSASGSVREQDISFPFGHSRISKQVPGELVSTAYIFAGAERDDESGLEHFKISSLIPWLGRFDRSDSLVTDIPFEILREPQRLNPYGYCSNKPLVRVDPNGALDVPTLLAGGGMFLGGFVTAAVSAFAIPATLGASTAPSIMGLTFGITSAHLGVAMMGAAFFVSSGDTRAREGFANAQQCAGVLLFQSEYLAGTAVQGALLANGVDTDTAKAMYDVTKGIMDYRKIVYGSPPPESVPLIVVKLKVVNDQKKMFQWGAATIRSLDLATENAKNIKKYDPGPRVNAGGPPLSNQEYSGQFPEK